MTDGLDFYPCGPGFPWSDNRKAALRRMWNAGASRKDIADALRTSDDMVSNWVGKLGLARRPRPPQPGTWTPHEIDKLRLLWAQGLTASRISSELSYKHSRNAVIGKVHRLRLPTRLTLTGERKRPGPKKGNPDAFRKSRAKPTELRVVRVKPPRPQEVPPPEARMISLMELTPSTCKWPIGHPGEAGFAFCGAGSFPSLPYCEHHARLAYMPPKERAERPAERVAA